MIAREWHARATPQGAEEYVKHYHAHVLPALRNLRGFRGSTVGLRSGATAQEIVVVTFWASLQAIKRFSGPDITSAIVDEAARPSLLSYDRTVTHWEVAAMDVVASGASTDRTHTT